MDRSVRKTKKPWAPSPEQLEVIDLLASGHSQQAVSRATAIPQQTIWTWLNTSVHALQFRDLLAQRTDDFIAARDAVHNQQVVMALQILQEALSGEMQRERVGDTVAAPLRYEAAIKLLQSTFWRQISGGHKQFGT